MMEKNKDAQKQSLTELQQEVKSLKALLLSRPAGGSSSSPSTPLPAVAVRPSMPAWQLSDVTLPSLPVPPSSSHGEGEGVRAAGGGLP